MQESEWRQVIRSSVPKETAGRRGFTKSTITFELTIDSAISA
jgi:hypothetical protein